MPGTGPQRDDMSQHDSDRIQQARVAAHEARRYVHRRRFGTVGTEPPEGRSAIRQYGSICVGIVAFLVALANVEAGAALTAISLAIGVPRSWTWANDRLSSLAWGVAVAMLVVGELLFILGDEAMRRTANSGHGTGAACLLVAFSNVVSVTSFYRRWGTPGNTAYWMRQRRKGDPDAIAHGQALGKALGRHYDDADE